MANTLVSPSSKARFSLPSSPSTSSPSDSEDDGDDIPLPFPAALPRSDFLAPNFQPAAYLSALPNRHQTLEDLRSDLRDRSATIGAELLELVNSNYTSFLSLGDELRGGDEKAENVKVALLGFQRAIGEVKGRVSGRKQEVEKLSGDLRDVRREIETGRTMLEVSDRLVALEERLGVESSPSSKQGGGKLDWGVSDEEDDYEDEEEGKGNGDRDDEEGRSLGLVGSSPGKLAASARATRQIERLAATLNEEHPFVIKLLERLARCRSTLLLDLRHALKEAKLAGPKGTDRVWRYVRIYRSLDAQEEAVKALRGG